MAKATTLQRLEAIEQRREREDGFQIVGRYVRNKDGGLTVYSDQQRYFGDTPEPEKVVQIVPKQRAVQWLKNLIRLQPLKVTE